MKWSVILACMLILRAEPHAQSYGGGGGPNAFYQIPMTPREIGMGATGFATATGAFATYWNPARAFFSFSENDSAMVSVGVVSQLGSIKMNNRIEKNDEAFGIYPSGVSSNSVSSYFRDQAGFILRMANVLRHLWDSLGTKMAIGETFQHRRVPGILRTDLSSSGEIVMGEAFDADEGVILSTIALKDFIVPRLDIGFNHRLSYTSYTTYNGSKLCYSGFDVGIFAPLWDSVLIFRELRTGQIVRMLKDDRNHELFYCFGLSWKISSTQFALDFSGGGFDPLTIALGAEFPIVDSWFLLRCGLTCGRNSNPDGDGVLLKCGAIGLGLSIPNLAMIDASYQFYLGNDGQYMSLVDSPLKLGINFTW